MLIASFRFLILLLCIQTVWAAPCEDVPLDWLELSLESIGTIYFGSAETRLQEGEIDLSRGVCIVGEGGWELQAESLMIRDLQTQAKFEAQDIQFSFTGWTLKAVSLRSDGASVFMADVEFVSKYVKGQAVSGRYELANGDIALTEVEARGQGFRIAGKRARLTGEVLIFEDAFATTCVCEGDALYVIQTPLVRYDLADEVIAIQDGNLKIGQVSIELDDVRISPETLEDLMFPLEIEYVTDNEAIGQQGTGLGIKIPSLPVDDTLSLEVGIVGIDVVYPLNGVLVVHYKDKGISFDLGKAAEGFQADIAIREPLLPWLSASFKLNNRHWQAQDFLHEGILGLESFHTVALTAKDRLSVKGSLFSAFSSQVVLDAPVNSPRLGTTVDMNYQSPALPFGSFGVSMRSQATYYPVTDKVQYGVLLQPSYRTRLGPVVMSTALRQQWTNGASPFATTLDRLEPESEWTLNIKASGDMAENLKASLGFSAKYDFLSPSPSGWSSFEVFRLDTEVRWFQEGLELIPSASAEFAPLFNSRLAESQKAFIEAGLDIATDTWRFGVAGRLNLLTEDGLEKIESRLTFPIYLSPVTLQPFLALDVLPTLRENTFPRVSGHGLEVSWQTCCGTIIAGYRQVENAFTTSFSIQFDEE